MPLFTILTLFPEALDPYLDVGVLGLARRRGLVETRLVDFRDWSRNRHRSVDDRPFGGGPGMVLRPETIVECVEWVDHHYGPHRKLVLCPSGIPFEQQHAAELASDERILLLAGRYEGFDERIFEVLPFERFSIGNFVLSGGELPALCIVDAVSRLIPGVLGDERSAGEDSFQSGDNLDHPHYTRPRVFRGLEVPPVLMGGDHKAIETWRKEQAEKRTKRRNEHVSGRLQPPPSPSNGDDS